MEYTPLSDLVNNILHDSKEEIETISRRIANQFGGVEQDVPGVAEDLEKVLTAYLHRTFKQKGEENDLGKYQKKRVY